MFYDVFRWNKNQWCTKKHVLANRMNDGAIFFQNHWLGYLLHSTYDPSHLVIPQHARRSQTGWWHFEWWFEGPWMDGSLWPQRVKIPQIWQLEIISSNRGSVMYHTFFHNKTKDVITVDCYATNFESGLVALGWCLMHSDAKDCTQQNLFFCGWSYTACFRLGMLRCHWSRTPQLPQRHLGSFAHFLHRTGLLLKQGLGPLDFETKADRSDNMFKQTKMEITNLCIHT